MRECGLFRRCGTFFVQIFALARRIFDNDDASAHFSVQERLYNIKHLRKNKGGIVYVARGELFWKRFAEHGCDSKDKTAMQMNVAHVHAGAEQVEDKLRKIVGGHVILDRLFNRGNNGIV